MRRGVWGREEGAVQRDGCLDRKFRRKRGDLAADSKVYSIKGGESHFHGVYLQDLSVAGRGRAGRSVRPRTHPPQYIHEKPETG